MTAHMTMLIAFAFAFAFAVVVFCAFNAGRIWERLAQRGERPYPLPNRRKS